MSIILSAICNKNGIPVLSKQFFNCKKADVEQILIRFSSLIEQDGQDTVIKTEDMRFLYSPIGSSLYFVLATTLDSNLIKDTETLNILVDIIHELCEEKNKKDKKNTFSFSLEPKDDLFVDTIEEKIHKTVFEIIFAIEETIHNGIQIVSSLPQLRTILQMESHDELIQNALIRDKTLEAKEAAKLKSKQLELEKNESALRMTKKIQPKYFDKKKTEKIEEKIEEKKILSLGKGKKIFIEEKEKKEDIVLIMEEYLSVVLNRDGGIKSFDVEGTFRIKIEEKKAENAQIKVNKRENISFQTHTNIDSFLFNEKSVLSLKSNSFPLKKKVPILKWKEEGLTDEDVPLRITCWPSTNSSSFETRRYDVSIEFYLEKDISLSNVVIEIPLGDSTENKIIQQEQDVFHDEEKNVFLWKINLISPENPTGLFEFSSFSSTEENFFPIITTFKGDKCVSHISPIEVIDSNTKESFSFIQTKTCFVESYLVEC